MKIKPTLNLLALAVALTTVSTVGASNSDFNYVAAQYVSFDQSEVDFDGGWGIGASFSFAGNWFVAGNNARADLTTDLGIDAEFTNWFLGGGYFWQTNERNNIYLQLSAETQKVKAMGASEDRRGASIELGDKFRLSDKWRFNAHARYSDINIAEQDDRSGEFYAGIGIDFIATDHFEIGANYEFGEFDRANFAFRVSF